MAPPPKKRIRAGGVQGTTSSGGQSHFPSTKRPVRSRTLARSAPSKRQQTITQMDPFHSIFHPNSEDENLEYDERIGDGYGGLSRKPKRRKSTPRETPVRRVFTRSAAGQITESAPGRQETRKDSAGQIKDCRVVKKEWRAQEPTTPLEPRTPRRTRKTEIPSSQSPADTPLSSHSLRYVRGVSRSPLKERSTNVTLHRYSTRKGAGWAQKLKVPDSMEDESFESPISTLNSENRGNASRVSSQETLSKPHDPLANNNGEGEHKKSTQSQHFKSAFLRNVESSELCELPYHTMSAQPFDDIRRVTQSGNLESASQFGNARRSYTSIPTYEQVADSETESQFENAWHPYVPPESSNPESGSNPFSSQPEKTNTPSSPPTTVRTQPSCSHPDTTPTTALKSFVPPSQATTMDASQQSSCKKTLSSQAFPSSPPPMPPPSSPPPTSRKAKDQCLSYEWNGERLYDSQLLPDSLMNDSLMGPPEFLLLSEENLEEEA